MRSKQSVTLVDLARSAGVSKTTASDALNNAGRVSERTREHVRKVARELGYVVNPSARSLRTSRGGIVGLYIPADVRDLEFYSDFTFGAVEAAGKHGADLALITTLPSEPGHWRTFSGVIVIDTLEHDEILASLISSEVPLVSAGEPGISVRDRMRAIVVMDHEEATYQALTLLTLGAARRPALVRTTVRNDSSWTHHVLSGYLRWAVDAAISPVVEAVEPFVGNQELVRTLDAVFENTAVDSVFFGLWDVGQRGQLLFSQSSYQSRAIALGTYTSRSDVDQLTGFEVTLNQEAYAFGNTTLNALMNNRDRPGSSAPIAYQHKPTVSRKDIDGLAL